MRPAECARACWRLGLLTGPARPRPSRARVRGKAVAEVADVNDKTSMARCIIANDRARPLDLVVANAGVTYATIGTEVFEDAAEPMTQTNVFGVLNTINPILERMRARRFGQVRGPAQPPP